MFNYRGTLNESKYYYLIIYANSNFNLSFLFIFFLITYIIKSKNSYKNEKIINKNFFLWKYILYIVWFHKKESSQKTVLMLKITISIKHNTKQHIYIYIYIYIYFKINKISYLYHLWNTCLIYATIKMFIHFCIIYFC